MIEASETVFQSLLQRRAKPIQWKWSQDLSKFLNKESQRRKRFLHDETETTVKWWEKMMPQNHEKITVSQDKYLGRYSVTKRNRLAEILRTGVVKSNSTELEREENIQHEFNDFHSPSGLVPPFDKTVDSFDASKYLSPTEKTVLNSHHETPVFKEFTTFLQERERKRDNAEKNNNQLSASNNGFGNDANVQEKSIIEKQITEHLIDSPKADLEVEKRVFKDELPSVEYVISSVEHVVPQVEYANSNFSDTERRLPFTFPAVQYVSSDVEFVEPEITYAAEKNTTEENNAPEIETPTKTDEADILVEDWPDDEIEPINKPEYKTVEDGVVYQIVGLRREQVRVRRNYARSLQLGLPEKDYPVLEALPVLQFYCGDYQPGYYVDITTRCQVFHICDENGQRSSFLCPVGTLFNQEYLVCDWWYNVNCQNSLFYFRTDSLPAYGTINENQKIHSKQVLINKIANKEASEAEGYVNQNSNPKSSENINFHQKPPSYPIGYAILLREYMRKSDPVVRKNSQLWQTNFNWDDNGTGTKILYTGSASSRNDQLNKEVQSNYDHEPSMNLPPRSEKDVFESYKNSRLSTEQNILQHQLKENKHENRTNYEPYLRKQYSKDIFEGKNATYMSLYSPKHVVTQESDKLETENPISMHQNSKSFDIDTKNKPILPTAKPGSVSKINFNKYRFIINPKEAVVPAKTQFADIGKHIQSNDSFVKFKQGKSIIKHIRPKNSETITTSSKHLKDSFAQHSELTYDKASRSRYRYGDRLSIKSRSIPENIQNLYLQEKNVDLMPASLPKFPYFYNNMGVSSRNKTEDPVPLASQNHMKFSRLNTASDIFLNNYKSEKEKIFNKSVPFYSKILNTDNEYLSDKRKITISVQIEQKKIMMEELSKNKSGNSNSPHKKNIHHPASLSSSKPLKDLFVNMPKLSKTKHPPSHNSTNQKLKNEAKISSSFGGFSITKLLGDTFRTSHEGREETQLYPVYVPPMNSNQQTSMTMSNKFD